MSAPPMSGACGVAILLWGAGLLSAADRPLLVPAAGSPLKGEGSALAVGDVNGDGRADLLLVQGTSLAAYFGDATRTWPQKPDAVTQLASRASEIALADLDGDMQPDLVLADHDSYGVAVMRGTGKGQFEAMSGSPFRSREGQQPHTHGLAIADMNRDGHLDIVTANNSDGDVSVLLGQPGGTWMRAAGSAFPCGRSPYPIAAADINRDGFPDILVPNAVHDSPDSKTLTVLLGNGRGQLAPAPRSPIATAATVWYVAAGDLNGDGHPDVAATHSEGSSGVTLLLNDGKGGLSPAPGSPLELDHGAWGVEIADMNRDGRADLVVAADESLRLFLGSGRGSFQSPPGSSLKTGKGAWRVCVADFNGDGKLDLATRCVEAKHVEIWQGN